MSYEPVPDGELAAVVTYLEMRGAAGPGVPPSTLSLRRLEIPSPTHYRALFRTSARPGCGSRG